MPLENDGDLVKAYGFVAIRFATLEDSVADRLKQAEPLLVHVGGLELDKIVRYRFSDQLKILDNILDWSKDHGPDFENKDDELTSEPGTRRVPQSR